MKTVKTKKTVKKRRQRPWNIYMVFAVMGVFVILVLYILSVQPDKKIEGNAVTTKPLSPFEMEKRDVTGKLPGQKIREDIERPIVQSIKLIPAEPTIFDSIIAEISTDYNKGKVTYEYLWEINNKPVTDIKGNTLPSGLFKKGDAIRVIVTPFVDEIKGHTHESMFIVVYSAPPSLELMETKQKLNNTIKLQLISKDPDNDKVTFSLEEPYPEGMTINKETGKIIWKPKKREKGTYTFSASATDIDGVKISKTFEFKID